METEGETVVAACNLYLQFMAETVSKSNVAVMEWRRRKLKRMRLQKLLLCHHLNICLMIERNVFRKKKSKNKVRSYDWWQRIVQMQFTDKDWLENFRVTRSTFEYVVDQLRDKLTPKDNTLNVARSVTDVEKKVGVSLYFLASCCEYRVAGNAFGIHKSTVHNIFHEFVQAVNCVLLPQYIHMPCDAEAAEIATCFQEASKLPNIIGAIDGTHIPILPPSQGYRDFVNRKGWPSIILQGVVDHKYRFRNICVKRPGATHDAAVLASSKLYRNINELLPQTTVGLDGQPVPYIILGDPAYPLLPWLMKPFSKRGLTPAQDSYNVYTSASRVAVEIAFGRLKARWRTLLKRCDVNYEFVPQIVAACCTLHNIVETRKDRFLTSWMDEIERAEVIFPQPPNIEGKVHDSFEAHNLRELLCQFLENNFPMRTSNRL